MQDGDLLAWAKADDAFHRLLAASCGNGRIARIAETTMDQSHRARMLSWELRPLPTGSIMEQQQIIRTIRKGQGARAHGFAQSRRVQARDTLLPRLEKFEVRHL